MSLPAAKMGRCRQAGDNNRNAIKRGRCSTRALKSRTGFTLTEALATVIIVGLATCILASGIALATRQYTQTMSTSEGQMLYSSLQKILETELGYTSSYTSDGNNEDGGVNVTGFSSKHYKAKSDDSATGSLNPIATENLRTLADGDSGVTIQDMNVPGRLAMCSADGKVTNPFLGAGSYNYGLQAYVGKLTYNKSKRMFTVGLGITKNGDTANPLIYEIFTVRALNLDMPSGSSNTGGSGLAIDVVPVDPGKATVLTGNPLDEEISLNRGDVVVFNGKLYIVNKNNLKLKGSGYVTPGNQTDTNGNGDTYIPVPDNPQALTPEQLASYTGSLEDGMILKDLGKHELHIYFFKGWVYIDNNALLWERLNGASSSS